MWREGCRAQVGGHRCGELPIDGPSPVVPKWKGGEKVSIVEGGKQRRRPRRPNRRLSRSGKDTGESGAERSEAVGGDKDAGDGDGMKVGRGERSHREPKPKSERRSKSEWDLFIRVLNFNRSTRIKELKQVLRDREANPMFIKWNGLHGKCYLLFPKKPNMNDDDAGTELLKQLDNLTVTVIQQEKDGGCEPKEVTLTCELRKHKGAFFIT